MGSGFLSAALSASDSQAVFSSENWKLLRSFNFYRLVIAILAIGLIFSGSSIAPFATTSPGLFRIASLLYGGIALSAVFVIRQRWGGYETIATSLAFIDIVLLTLLIHASGGMEGGTGLLLLIAVAGASLMLSTRLTILFAALATIAIGIEVNWAFLTEGEWVMSRWNTGGYTQMGLLGIGLFVTATLTHLLARRLRATEALAVQRGVDLANLAQLNELVIARMHSGVLACDMQGNVHMVNKTARAFLGLDPQQQTRKPLQELSAELDDRFRHWLGSTATSVSPVIQSAGFTLLPRFQPIGGRREDQGVLIFLDDTAVIRQQAAQLKMAALARLTASIAHEIRNPLGAIAHAAQLLAESAGHNEEETRLLRIVQDQSKRMNVIIENVTQLSRRDKLNLARIRLDAWVPEFMRQFTLDGQTSTAIFQTQGVKELTICFDPEQLYQVVHNLCTNALRHSPAFSGQPLIAIKTDHDPEDRPFLEVIDWGKGVPADIVDSIFDPFFTTTAKGTGLGLYISRELCEGNGGLLDYFPGENGVGTRFRITFARSEDCNDLVTGTL